MRKLFVFSFFFIGLCLQAEWAFSSTCNVPTSSYPSIQSAVDDPICNVGYAPTSSTGKPGSPYGGRGFGSDDD